LVPRDDLPGPLLELGLKRMTTATRMSWLLRARSAVTILEKTLLPSLISSPSSKPYHQKLSVIKLLVTFWV
jgi:hypothetical protein